MNQSEGRRVRGGALNGVVALAAVALSLALVACGDATCPKGSKSIDGECVPASKVECDGGLERVDGVCMDTSSVSGGGKAGTSGSAGRGGRSGGGAGTAGSVPAEDAGSDASIADAGTDAATDAMVGEGPDTAGAVEPGTDGGAGPLPETCEGFACEGRSHCELVADQPQCVCDTGFIGARCAECALGLGMKNGECVPLCEADAAPDCGAHGSCELEGTVTSCKCEHPFGGPLCQGCAQNFRLDATGTCVPDCGVCTAHSFCNGSLMVPDCSCYPGYVKQGAVCSWSGNGTTGGIVNGALLAAPGWSTDGNVTVGGNMAIFQPSSSQGTNCDLGQLTQTLRMPTREQAEPLMLEIRATSTCTDRNGENCPPLLVELGSSVTRVRMPGGSSPVTATHRVCLGDDGYGDQVQLRIRPGAARVGQTSVSGVGFVSMPSGFDCSAQWPILREVRIVATSDAACALENGFVDPEFKVPAAWSLAGGASITEDPGFMTLPSGGTARAPFLLRRGPDIQSPGLFVRLQDAEETSGRVQVRIDGLPIATLESGPSSSVRYACIPDWAYGSGHELELRGLPLSTVTVHAIEVADEARCRGGAFDDKFVRPLGTGSWFIHELAQPNTAYVDTNSSVSHDGGTYSVLTSLSILGATMRVPAVSASAGPAIAFASRISAGATGKVEFLGEFSALKSTAAVQSVAYSTWSQCLDRIWRGQLMYVAGIWTASADAVRIDEYGIRNLEICP